MTAYTTSTNTTFVDTYTISGTSTILNATTTATAYTSTSIVGVVGGDGGWSIVPILIVLVPLLILSLALLNKRKGKRRR